MNRPFEIYQVVQVENFASNTPRIVATFRYPADAERLRNTNAYYQIRTGYAIQVEGKYYLLADYKPIVVLEP